LVDIIINQELGVGADRALEFDDELLASVKLNIVYLSGKEQSYGAVRLILSQFLFLIDGANQLELSAWIQSSQAVSEVIMIAGI